MSNSNTDVNHAVLAVPCDQPIIVPADQLERAREEARKSKPSKDNREENAKKARAILGKPSERDR